MQENAVSETYLELALLFLNPDLDAEAVGPVRLLFLVEGVLNAESRDAEPFSDVETAFSFSFSSSSCAHSHSLSPLKSSARGDAKV